MSLSRATRDFESRSRSLVVKSDEYDMAQVVTLSGVALVADGLMRSPGAFYRECDAPVGVGLASVDADRSGKRDVHGAIKRRPPDDLDQDRV